LCRYCIKEKGKEDYHAHALLFDTVATEVIARPPMRLFNGFSVYRSGLLVTGRIQFLKLFLKLAKIDALLQGGN
jgi:hypothetical protein